jgi:cobalt/nickel transport system permease protein
MASILTVQALFFADGGLLALGCNIFNLGFFPAFVAYPLVFKPLAGKDPTPPRLSASSVTAAVTGLLLGALAVVLQTVASGITELPFRAFASFMLPIHFVIGIVEGLITAAVVTFVWKARPEVLQYASEGKPMGGVPVGRIAAVLVAAAVVIGGGLSWFSSSLPDGLEWSVKKTAGVEHPERSGGDVHSALRSLQERTAAMPDYAIPAGRSESSGDGGLDGGSGPNPGSGRSLAGIVGGFLSLLLAVAVGYAFRGRPAGGKGRAVGP